MKKTIFQGAGVAIVTPMFPDGSINFDKLGELIDWQIAEGTDAIIICGTTGESTCMTDQEHVDCISHAVKRVDHRVPVVAGAGSNDTRYAVELSKEAARLGADALLHVTPYYNKTSQRGLVKHFTDIADATDLPVVLYNVPSRTGLSIQPETFQILAGHPHIVADKEASGDISHVAKVRALCGDSLDVYSGNDDQTVAILALGGKGVISVLSNLMPRQTHEICSLWFEGKTAASARLALELLDLANGLFLDVNPIPVKEAMNLMGLDVGECRAPLVTMSDEQRAKLSALLKKHGLTK